MPTYETRALVVKLIPFRESDRIVWLVTRDHGLVSVLVSGARKSHKRFSNLFDLGNLISVKIATRRNGMARVDSGVLLDGFWELSASAACLAAACHVIELARSFSVEGEPEEELFDLCAATLLRLARRGLSHALLRAFELRLLSAVGIAPNVEHCVRCRRDVSDAENASWSVAKSGMVCASCAEGRELSALPSAARRWMRATLDASLDDALDAPAPADAIGALNIVLPRQLEYQLGRPLKALRFARGLPKPADYA